MRGAVFADVADRFGQDEPAVALELFPDQLADHPAVAAVVELRDEIEGNRRLAFVGGLGDGKQ